jgi:Zn-dependent peptidase ImmA (M78 family)
VAGEYVSSLQLTGADDDVRKYARGALRAAAVGDRLPVPLSDIAAAVDLHKHSLFDLGEEKDLPPDIRSIFKKLKGKVLGLLDVAERQYFVDTSLPIERQRFTEAHEIGHDALPWHKQAYFGDDLHTLAHDTRQLLEIEANLFSAEILFAGKRFNREADDWAPSLDVPLALNTKFQVSAAAAIRRYVAGSKREVALIGTGLYGGTRGVLPIFDGITNESARFRERYGPVRKLLPARLTASVYQSLAFITADRRGAVESCDVTLATLRGPVKFLAEGFVNGRNGFILLSHRRRLDGQRLTLI